MRKLLYSWLILFAICTVAHADTNGYMSGGSAGASCADSSCTGFLVCQNFETSSTGWDNGPESWTASCGTGNTCTPAYATNPLRGTQSFYIQIGTTTTTDYYISHTAANEVYGFARVFFDTDAGHNLIAVRNNTTSLLLIGWNTANNKFFYDAAVLGSSVYVHNTTYYIWWRYKICDTDCEGTGNLTKTVWIGTSPDFDAASVDYSVTTGTTTTQTNRLYLRANADNANYKYDQVLTRTTAIGDVCE